MVLFAIVGELGSGKTLALTYLAWNNWYHKKRRIYSNYDLYGFPYTKIESVPDLDKMSQGFFAGDELWLWLDSWEGRSKKQRLISSILLKSRKRNITIAFTSQSISQISKRIRDITDFIAYPLLSTDDSYCRLEVFRGSKPMLETRIKPAIYFWTEPVIAMFNTYQEVKPLSEETKMTEVFNPVWRNPAWIRYLKEQGKSKKEIMELSKEIQQSINPEGITSEAQRRKEEEDYLLPEL